MQMTFSPGDKVVHPGKGAGVVTEYRTVGTGDNARHYLIMDLQDGHNSVLMLPVERLADIGLRPVIMTLDLVESIMYATPTDLDTNHRVRQAQLEEQLKSGDAPILLAAMRDLYWRDHLHGLTGADKKLLSRIRKQLERELALSRAIAPAIARTELQTIADRAIEKHAAQA